MTSRHVCECVWERESECLDGTYVGCCCFCDAFFVSFKMPHTHIHHNGVLHGESESNPQNISIHIRDGIFEHDEQQSSPQQQQIMFRLKMNCVACVCVWYGSLCTNAKHFTVNHISHLQSLPSPYELFRHFCTLHLIVFTERGAKLCWRCNFLAG